jgi:hypothetical protein
MSELEIGQVVSLRIRFNNRGDIAKSKHPYLVVGIDEELGTVEIAQLDSLKGKEYKSAFKSNKTIFCSDPAETVIDKDSYIQLDNTIRIEDFNGISAYRRQPDKLSKDKLQAVLNAYRHYHDTHIIDENKNVYLDQAEIKMLNT